MSKVAVIRFSRENAAGPLTEKEYSILLEAGLRIINGRATAAETVRLLMPSGVVGMKTNCLTGKLNSTPPALVDALSKLLVGGGIDENNIVVWERTNRELESAGFKLNASSFGRRCIGTDTGGYGYGTDFATSGEVNTLISRILNGVIDHNINLPVLKDHSIAGLSGCLKNMFGAIHNPNKFHDNNCDPFAADVSNLAPIKRRHRLGVIDAVRVQYNNGPGFDSRHLIYYDGIIMSEDPVAADRVGLEILEHCRAVNNLPPLEKTGRPVKYLKSAEERGVGVADLNGIDLSVISVDADGNRKEAELL